MDLSIHVRRMKFMQRGQSEETNKSLQETSGKIINDEQWEIELPTLSEKCSKYDTIDITELCDLRYGRMSFQGFNKLTEKMTKYWNNEAVEDEERKSDEDSIGSISDEEMADRFTTLVGTVAKKYLNKKKVPKRSKGKRKLIDTEKGTFDAKQRKQDSSSFFIKPADD
uniref:M-phase phosphoprotein 6-like n=1 Tax=Styela clava TaxID=7725 RepID=UPI00193AA0D6|nr:M-phase phosphoprotein 6-like [Styela clava]